MINELIPEKSKRGNWTKYRGIGEWGEKWLIDFLRNKKFEITPLNYYSMADKETRERFWKELKAYPKIPDFITKYKNNVLLFDAKTKRKYTSQPPKFYVNIRDYNHYKKFIDIVPVWIFFIIIQGESVAKGLKNLSDKDVIRVDHHVVRREDYPEVFVEHDKNRCYDLKNYLDKQWL